MKIILSLLTTIVSLSSFAQVSDYTVYPDSLFGCTPVVYFALTGGPLDDNATITFDWGDGTIVTENVFVAGNTNEFVTIYHSYANGGTYTSETQVFSSNLGANIDAGEINPLTVNGASTCGLSYIQTLQLPNIYYSQVPLDFTDNLGVTTTITPTSGNVVYEGLNPANAPYSVSINDAWLLTQSLAQTSSDITITGFDAQGYGISSSYQLEVTCNGNLAQPDLMVSYGFASNFVAPLQTGLLQLSFCNISCSNSQNATVNITIPSMFVPNITGLTNPTMNGNILSFDLVSLSGCEAISIPFTFPGTVAAGTQICFDIDVVNNNDLDLSNNSMTVCGTVLNSYDPNDKQVNLPIQINPDNKEQFVYKIQFQNDGNYNAVNVKVTDIIDTDLDLSTFKVLDSKHGLGTSINSTTREVTFTFANAQLSPSSEDLEGSQGYVVYSIEENDNLIVGTEIENTASIYFDFNPAIVTNTTYNVNAYEVGLNALQSDQFTMYPNPANTQIQFKGLTITEIEVVNLEGKSVMIENNPMNNSLDVSSLSNGFYQVIIKTDNGTYINKLSIQH